MTFQKKLFHTTVLIAAVSESRVRRTPSADSSPQSGRSESKECRTALSASSDWGRTAAGCEKMYGPYGIERMMACECSTMERRHSFVEPQRESTSENAG